MKDISFITLLTSELVYPKRAAFNRFEALINSIDDKKAIFTCLATSIMIVIQAVLVRVYAYAILNGVTILALLALLLAVA